MIAKQIKGIDFKAALSYNFKKMNLSSENKASILGSNFSDNSQKVINREIYVSRSLRPNLKRFFYHTALSFHPSENLADEKMKSIGEAYLQKNGFNQHSYIMFRHRDANHPHMHILVSRIGFDGSLVSDSNDYHRSETSVREIESEFELMPNISSKMAQKRAVTVDEIEMMKRTGEPSKKFVLQEKLEKIISRSKNMEDFITECEKEKINLQFNQASTGRVSGISYLYEGFKAKGQGLGNKFKFLQMAKILKYEQQADHERIFIANKRTAELEGSQNRRANLQGTGIKDPPRDHPAIQEDRGKNRGFKR